jgi:hypothetical protein
MLRFVGYGLLALMLASFLTALFMGVAIQLLVFFVVSIAAVIGVGFVLSRIKGPPPGDLGTL